jgi:RNA polymerase sigma factor (sigma-70 family)
MRQTAAKIVEKRTALFSNEYNVIRVGSITPPAGVLMQPHESVSEWLIRLKAGDHQAAEEIWEQYFSRLTALARQRIANAPRTVADEEDVVASVFESFFRQAHEGKFPQLDDRQDLWKLLITITVRKAGRQAKRARNRDQTHRSPVPIEEHVDAAPHADFTVEVTDELRRLFGMLDDPKLKVIGMCKLEGLTNAKIAKSLECSIATVERKLQVIRRLWKAEV